MIRYALLVALLSPSPLLAEGDPAEGRKLARMCAACHGRDGVAVRPHTPNIAGLEPDYIALQLADYRAGNRQHEEMNVVAKPLSDVQIANLAAWFSGQKAP